jgi:hypothetical protein
VTMSPTELIGPPSPLGYPAPYWFLVTFKVLGFTLHMGPMHLWFAGILVAMVLARWGSAEAHRWSARLMRQMPVIIALGINFGIVPLLFTQVAYYRVFLPRDDPDGLAVVLDYYSLDARVLRGLYLCEWAWR